MLSFMTVRRLQVLIDYYRDKIEGGARAVFGGVERALHPYGTLPDAGGAVYADALAGDGPICTGEFKAQLACCIVHHR